MRRHRTGAIKTESDDIGIMKNTEERSIAEEAESILHIDEHRLNKECVRLPNQYRQAAFQAAETDRDLAEAKAERDVVEAELRLKVRGNPEAHGLDKLTEGTINEIVSINPKLAKLDARIRKLKHRQDLEKALVSALEVKKRSLTNLVELHGAGYFAEVRPSEKGREKLDRISRERQARPLPRDRKEK